ncbi:hypothetical protein F2Q68_00035240 [Brassica cretica]|uniref:MATH domain-containing protein n=2 Tax=Brassica cretica TaxID=69181 RepID=A0A8S9H564_BRACR|nr:hypothetical protein F2Q68_00035240 [Brassica cretica]
MRGGDRVPSHFSRLFLFLSVSILSEGDKTISHRLGGHVSVGGSRGRKKTAGLIPVLSSTKEAGDVSIVVAPVAGDLDARASPVDGFVASDDELVFERDPHVAGEDDPERLRLYHMYYFFSLSCEFFGLEDLKPGEFRKVRFLFQYVFGDVDEYGDCDDLDFQMELMYVSIVRPIMDFIEVTFHYIECIHFYSKNSESQLGQQASEVTQLQMANSGRWTLHIAFDASTPSRLNAFCIIKVRFLFQYVFGDVDEYGDCDDLDFQMELIMSKLSDGDIINIANIVEIAAINMMRDERTEIKKQYELISNILSVCHISEKEMDPTAATVAAAAYGNRFRDAAAVKGYSDDSAADQTNDYQIIDHEDKEKQKRSKRGWCGVKELEFQRSGIT